MNTMTFTIGSVHGVKQTLILGSFVQRSDAIAGEDQNCDLDRLVDSGSSTGSRLATQKKSCPQGSAKRAEF